MLKLKTIFFALIAFCAVSYAQEKQATSLESLYAQYESENILPKDASWFPYPAYSERNAWDELLGSHAAHLITQGEKYLDFTWQSVNATAYLAYERTGNRQVMEKPMSANRVALNALM